MYFVEHHVQPTSDPKRRRDPADPTIIFVLNQHQLDLLCRARGLQWPREIYNSYPRQVIASVIPIHIGMRITPRTPLRASPFDPATAVLTRLSNRTTPRFSPSFRSPVQYARAHSSTLTKASTRCRQCSLSSPSKNHYSTRTAPLFSATTTNNNARKEETDSGSSQTKFFKYAVIGGVVVIGAVAFSDKVQHGYRAAERTGRVVGALAVCINE